MKDKILEKLYDAMDENREPTADEYKKALYTNQGIQIAVNIIRKAGAMGIEKMGGIICPTCRTIVMTPDECIKRYSKGKE